MSQKRPRSSSTAVRKALNPVLKQASTRKRMPAKATSAPPGRLAVVDAARGFAITMMIAYHFCFDLTYVGWASWQMLDDVHWIAWRDCIVTSFVFLVGVSLALRDDRQSEARWFEPAFVRRWLQIAAAAALVTAGSMLLFPDRYIYFGVLHFVAVALWLCRRASRRPTVALALGVAIIAAGNAWSSTAFDPRAIDWIGFAATKPPTEDYVPLFPWLGATLLGCGLGGLWTRRHLRMSAPAVATWNAVPAPLRRGWAALGRWSLTIYLVHQPLLLGAMTLIKRLP